MIIIKPETVTESTLISSNVPENDYAVWVSGSNYAIGDRRIYQHRIYEAIQTITGSTIPPSSNPAFWLNIGATNRYREFDRLVNSQTSNADSIDVTLRMGAVVNGIAVFEMVATTLRVVMTDPSAGVVYDRTVDLTDFTTITGYYAYFFEPVSVPRTDYILLDLPTYPAADIRVLVSNPGNATKAGEIVLGAQKMIGTSTYGTKIGIRDYSRKDFDEFGNIVIIKRNFAKTADYAVTIDTPTIGNAQRYFAEIRSTACVFIGDPARDETIVYGFYKDFQTVIGAPSVSDCSILVEGLT